VFWVATIPAVIAVIALVIGVQEPAPSGPAKAKRPALKWSDLKTFSRDYWWVVAIGGVFTLARFSEAFLVLRAQSIGLSASYVPVVMVVMNIAYGLSAYPAGVLADRMSHRGLLAAGLAVLVVADLVLASATGVPLLFAGVLLWGTHMGLTQGLLSAMVAGCAPSELRGTGFGFFNLVSGVALLPASAIAGLLWVWIGPSATFLCGGAFAALTLIAVFGSPGKS
jgi:predicted MFS family arabinose efflux permease